MLISIVHCDPLISLACCHRRPPPSSAYAPCPPRSPFWTYGSYRDPHNPGSIELAVSLFIPYFILFHRRILPRHPFDSIFMFFLLKLPFTPIHALDSPLSRSLNALFGCRLSGISWPLVPRSSPNVLCSQHLIRRKMILFAQCCPTSVLIFLCCYTLLANTFCIILVSLSGSFFPPVCPFFPTSSLSPNSYSSFSFDLSSTSFLNRCFGLVGVGPFVFFLPNAYGMGSDPRFYTHFNSPLFRSHFVLLLST